MGKIEKRDATDPIPSWLLALKESTPARVLVGRAGPALRTATHLELKADHAAARDAVHADLDLARDLTPDLVDRLKLFLVQSRAETKREYLLRPDLGRQLGDDAAEMIRQRCEPKVDIQFVIGDGLSATAVATQVPSLLPMLTEAATSRGLRVGQPFAIRHCRVGILNDIGEILDPAVVVLLIGERPGLVTAESLSAYLAYRPRRGHTDAHRNLISNIHRMGVNHKDACRRILALVDQMLARQLSGVEIKEELEVLAKPNKSRVIERG